MREQDGAWRWTCACAVVAVLTALSLCHADEETTLSDVPRGAAHSTHPPRGHAPLFDSGIVWGAGLTQIYQQNAHGGQSTSGRAGRYSGSYDLEASLDLDRALGWADSTVYVLLEGGGPGAGGIDTVAVGSYFGVNADGIAEEWVDVAELWYLQSLAADRLFLQVGKVDLTAGIEYRDVLSAFDLNRYANDEKTQFLNGALINNPTIPFPAYSFGVSAVSNPWDRWQFAAAGATQTAEADIDECRTWASDDEGLFFILQASFLPSAGRPEMWDGEFHAGAWWTGGGDVSAREEQTGVYLSASQEVFKANGNPDDKGGMGVFARYGWADGDTVRLEQFWSVGLQYHGWLASREKDVLALGFARGAFADDIAVEGSEAVVELYYKMVVTPWLSVTPDIQYIEDAGGETGAADALVVALRAQVLLE